MSYLVSTGSTHPIINFMADGLRAFVQTRRTILGLTQKELAEAAGINQPTISDIERGQTKLPNADIRRRLAAALGVSHLDLLVAAGEITEQELGTTVGLVEVAPDDPRQDFIRRLERLRWTDGVTRSLEWVVGTLEREQGILSGDEVE